VQLNVEDFHSNSAYNLQGLQLFSEVICSSIEKLNQL